MWLINCRTSLLEEFVNCKEVKYAILSHTWEKGEEVQHNEFKNRGPKEKRGWQKINRTCQLALDDGCDFVWVDTCCIDKTSSAELSEAINSMFPWYRGSEICYAYLADYDASDPNAHISQSRWFTRGWTLQELIAPARVRFYDKSWKSIGMKDVLSQQLSPITGIEQEILLAFQDLEELLDQVPIARRLSWAAKRETTRVEDIAYCLLGIFRVNLPLLYGEGERAFIRLQEEIVRNSDDLSLLAWVSSKDDIPANADCYSGIFAQHPRDFKASNNLALTNDVKFTPEYTMTNKGLKIQTQLTYSRSEDLHILELNCHNVGDPRMTLGIFLKHQGAGVFARARPHLFASKGNVSSITDCKSFFLSKSISSTLASSLHTVHRCSFVVCELKSDYWYNVAAKPEALWDSGKSMFITAGLNDFVGCYEYASRKDWQRRSFVPAPERVFIIFGYGYGYCPWVHVDVPSSEDLYKEIKRGNWKRVAVLVNMRPRHSVIVGKTYNPQRRNGEKHWSMTAELEQAIQKGEPVYSVKCVLTPR